MLQINITNNLSHHARPEFGNYDYEVIAAGKVIASGELWNHRRDDGWEVLVQQLLENQEVLGEHDRQTN